MKKSYKRKKGRQKPIGAITEKLDNIVSDSVTPFGDDEAEDGTIRLTPVNTEKELDMLLTHVLGDDGGGGFSDED